MHYNGFLILLPAALFILLFIYFLIPEDFYAQHRIVSAPIGNFDDDKLVLILFWTKIFGSTPPFHNYRKTCSLMKGCSLTADRSLATRADAIVFHASDLKTSEQDESFSIDSNARNVFYTQETYSALIQFHLHSLPRNFFHWTMTFHASSNIPAPYGGYFVPPELAKRKSFSKIKLPFDNETILRSKKVKGILWFTSDCKTRSLREKFVQELSKYIQVDIAGLCAQNEIFKNLCPRDLNNQSSCDGIKSSYYFYIVAENDMCEWYITEKFWDNYALPIVLIVQQRHIYDEKVPPGSVIAMDDFDGPQAMAQYLKWLIDNPDEYVKKFSWRKEGWAVAPSDHYGYRQDICRLCEKLLEENIKKDYLSMRKNNPYQPIPSVLDWYKDVLNCTPGDEFFKDWMKREKKREKNSTKS